MSTHPTAPAVNRRDVAAATPARPGTLKAALGGALASAAAAIALALVMITGGAELILEIAAEQSGVALEPEVLKAAAAGLKDDVGAVETFKNRAMVVMVAAGLFLLFTLLMGKAATWARVLVTITGLLSAGACILVVVVTKDDTNGLMAALGWASVILAAVALVLTWLPANGQYRKALKHA